MRRKEDKDLTEHERLILQAMWEVSAEKVGMEQMRKVRGEEDMPWMSADEIMNKILDIVDRNRKMLEWDK